MEVEATDGYLPCKYQFNFSFTVWTFALLEDEDNSLLSLFFVGLVISVTLYRCLEGQKVIGSLYGT